MRSARSFWTTFSHTSGWSPGLAMLNASSERPPVFERSLWHVTQYRLTSSCRDATAVAGSGGCYGWTEVENAAAATPTRTGNRQLRITVTVARSYRAAAGQSTQTDGRRFTVESLHAMRPILLVEDDPNDAILVRDTLEQVNLINEIDVATTVDAARAFVRRSMPAL